MKQILALTITMVLFLSLISSCADRHSPPTAPVFSPTPNATQTAGVIATLTALPTCVETVTFPDPYLEESVRDEINKPYGDICKNNCETVTELFIPGETKNLSGIENCINLKKIYSKVSDISFFSDLASLPKLTILYMTFNDINDISPISSLANLQELYLGWNNITDISPLSNLINLKKLFIHTNNITDLSPLSGLTNLTMLHIGGNYNLSDLSPLSGLTNLGTLDMRRCNISDLSPLSGLTNLGWLGADKNSISNISTISNLTRLSTLKIEDNNISDISPIVECYNSGGFQNSQNPYIDIELNPLNTQAINVDIPYLQSKDITVRY